MKIILRFILYPPYSVIVMLARGSSLWIVFTIFIFFAYPNTAILRELALLPFMNTKAFSAARNLRNNNIGQIEYHLEHCALSISPVELIDITT
jgi:hypothetical protein